MAPRPEALCAEEDAELERHVEARELGVGVKFGTRDVVDSEATAGNQFEDLFDAHLAGVIDFQCAARDVATVED